MKILNNTIFCLFALILCVSIPVHAEEEVSLDPGAQEQNLGDIELARERIVGRFNSDKELIDFNLSKDLEALGQTNDDVAERVRLIHEAKVKKKALRVKMRKDLKELDSTEGEIAPWRKANKKSPVIVMPSTKKPRRARKRRIKKQSAPSSVRQKDAPQDENLKRYRSSQFIRGNSKRRKIKRIKSQ